MASRSLSRRGYTYEHTNIKINVDFSSSLLSCAPSWLNSSSLTTFPPHTSHIARETSHTTCVHQSHKLSSSREQLTRAAHESHSSIPFQHKPLASTKTDKHSTSQSVARESPSQFIERSAFQVPFAAVSFRRLQRDEATYTITPELARSRTQSVASLLSPRHTRASIVAPAAAASSERIQL